MPRVAFNALAKKKSSTRKRRTSVATRAKYLPKTARANRSLIRANASEIRAVRRLVPPPIYTDWQYTSSYAPFTTAAPGAYFNILSAELMNPTLWDPVLRQDANVITASSTLVKRMQLNLRYSLGESDWCQITTFVVSLRKDAADRVVEQNLLIPGSDYIYSDQNYNPRLNSKVFKVHYVRNLSLMSNTWMQPQANVGGSTFSGNPFTTLGKGQLNVKLDHRIRQPNGNAWGLMTQDQFPPAQRLYLLTFFKGSTQQPDDDPARVDWDAQYVCYNSS